MPFHSQAKPDKRITPVRFKRKRQLVDTNCLLVSKAIIFGASRAQSAYYQTRSSLDTHSSLAQLLVKLHLKVASLSNLKFAFHVSTTKSFGDFLDGTVIGSTGYIVSVGTRDYHGFALAFNYRRV